MQFISKLFSFSIELKRLFRCIKTEMDYHKAPLEKQTMNNNNVIRRISIKCSSFDAQRHPQPSLIQPVVYPAIEHSRFIPSFKCIMRTNVFLAMQIIMNIESDTAICRCTLPLHNFILHRNSSKVNNKYLLLQALDMNWKLFQMLMKSSRISMILDIDLEMLYSTDRFIQVPLHSMYMHHSVNWYLCPK